MLRHCWEPWKASSAWRSRRGSKQCHTFTGRDISYAVVIRRLRSSSSSSLVVEFLPEGDDEDAKFGCGYAARHQYAVINTRNKQAGLCLRAARMD